MRRLRHPHGEEARSAISNQEGFRRRDAWTASWFETAFGLLTMRLPGYGGGRLKFAPGLALATLLAATAAVGTSLAAEPPYKTIRNLKTFQDQIAKGSSIAQAAYGKAIARAARELVATDRAVWHDARNARALVTYLFSGGDASAIAKAVPVEAMAADYRKLYAGALAYGLGDDEAARTALLPIEAKSLPSGLGGHLALVQATLLAETDRPKAIALLDLARLLEPGTLIEEAALRKEMSLIGATGDIEKFGALARRYMSGFARSVYAANFRQLVATAAVQTGSADSDEAAQRLTRLAASLGKEDRQKLFLAIARAAVIAGRTKMAVHAAEEAGRLTTHASVEEARANVYLAAATVVGDRYDAATKLLQQTSVDRLGMGDRALRASAIVVAEMIRRPMAASAGKAGSDANALAIDGEHSLDEADRLLRKVRK